MRRHGAAGAVREAEARLPAAGARGESGRSRDERVPTRNPEVRGPLGVYYYDHLAEVLGPDAKRDTALERRPNGELLAYEALNLADGRRTVAEIRDVLTGRYAPVPEQEVGEYLTLLARASVVSLK